MECLLTFVMKILSKFGTLSREVVMEVMQEL